MKNYSTTIAEFSFETLKGFKHVLLIYLQMIEPKKNLNEQETKQLLNLLLKNRLTYSEFFLKSYHEKDFNSSDYYLGEEQAALFFHTKVAERTSYNRNEISYLKSWLQDRRSLAKSFLKTKKWIN